MTNGTLLPVWASVLIFIACLAAAVGTVALAGSKKYAKRVPNALKIALAFVLSQAACMYFLPLMRLMNFLPGLLSGNAAEIALYAGEALGIVWSLPCGVTVCYALMPRNRAGLIFGLLSVSLMAVFGTMFLITALSKNQLLTAVFCGLSLLFGVIAFIMALERRKKKR